MVIFIIYHFHKSTLYLFPNLVIQLPFLIQIFQDQNRFHWMGLQQRYSGPPSLLSYGIAMPVIFSRKNHSFFYNNMRRKIYSKTCTHYRRNCPFWMNEKMSAWLTKGVYIGYFETPCIKKLLVIIMLIWLTHSAL
jgi:hypothetical protein